MRLTFKQRFFSWFDSYDIYGENGEVVFTVKGKLSWGHCFKIYDHEGIEIGMIKQRLLTLLSKFELYREEECIGLVKRELTLFRPRYTLDFNGWSVEGDFMQWDYNIKDSSGLVIATARKELFRLTDTYVIDVYDENNALFLIITAFVRIFKKFALQFYMQCDIIYGRKA